MIKLLKNMRKREVLTALLCAVLVVGQVYFDLRLPDFMSELTLLIKSGGDATGDIVTVGLKMLACTLASAALAIACGYLSAQTASGFSYTLRERIFNRVTDIGKAEMQDISVPSLITRTTNDVNQIQMIVSMGLQMMIKSPIMAVWAVIKILGKSWELSAVTAAFVVVICATILTIMSICLPRFRMVQKLTDKINRVARENLTGINVVHAFNAENYQNAKFDVPSGEMMNLQLKNQRLFALMQPVMGLGMNGLALVIYWLGAALVNAVPLSDPAGRLGMFSEVVVFSTYATYVVMSFMMLVMIFMLLPQAQVSAERINEVLDKSSSIVSGSVTECSESGTVEFRNVSFKYPNAAENSLSNINFSIGKGQTLAIIGATGSGKTTLVGLIPRFYDASSGTIRVDGRNVNSYSLEELREKVHVVLQRAVLFRGTLRENLLWGNKNANDEEMQAAVKAAQAADFVQSKGGLDMKITAEGRNLSGGQRQRLSIARALVGNPEILILDDSASALDYVTEKALRGALSALPNKPTVFIVSQRTSSLRHADKILVLDNGALVGCGTHDALLANCSVYREIYDSQFGGKEAAAK